MSNVVSLIPTEKLVSLFEGEVRKLLREHQLYAIESMGYLDSEEKKPDYLGICHWIENPRINLQRAYFDLETEENVSEFNHRATDEELELSTISADIAGLFELSYLSLGQLIVIFSGCTGESRYQKFLGEPVKLQVNDKSIYWLNYNTTVIYLSTLSDRLCKYLIQIFKEKAIEIEVNDKTDFDKDFFYKVRRYVAEFSVPVDIDYNKFKSIANSIKKRRRIRNDLVHKVSTESARIEKVIVSSSKLSDEQGLVKQGIGQSNCTDTSEDINNQLDFCKSWYLELIELANMIFIIERQSRI